LTKAAFVEFLSTANLTPQEGKNVNSLAKRLAVVLVVLAIIVLPLAAFAAEEGADVYKSAKPACTMCHGTDGKKMAGTKQFASPDVQKMSDEELTATITKGKPEKKMPGYEGKLTPEQIKALVAYIRSFKK
jgi:mono/diheme cytochrome c family protein